MLTTAETAQLATLLKKAEWPLPPAIFHALLGMTVSVPLELAVFNAAGEVLLVYRDDHEFTGWHMPGTVLRDNENVAGGLTRLIKSEVGTATTTPISLGWTEVERSEHFVRHEVSLLHMCFVKETYVGEGTFFDPNHLPEDTLTHHKILVPMMLERIREMGLGLSKP